MTAKHLTEKTSQRRGMTSFLPILTWLPEYDRTWLSADVIAGLTLWGLVVPESAYAGIAGLPPQAGLYTLLAALFVYALLGTSRHLVVQVTSATAALLPDRKPGSRPKIGRTGVGIARRTNRVSVSSCTG